MCACLSVQMERSQYGKWFKVLNLQYIFQNTKVTYQSKYQKAKNTYFLRKKFNITITGPS